MSYRLTRFVLLRLLGLVYAVAFLVAINQIVPLVGAHGLTPMALFVDRGQGYFGSLWAGFFRLPSLFWFWHSDATLLTWAWIGFVLSCLVLAGYANALILTALWLIYMSYVHLGELWYGYGWETQLLETGFLAIFLCPLLDLRPFPKQPPPVAIIWLFRWLQFRIMLGSALIKLRGDPVWRNLTALYYHFETQPIPNPLSRWFHFLPRLFLRLGVQFNFLAELVAPWFLFWPRIARHIAALVIIAFQVTLILGGNLSFLNWLTIIPALASLDDSFWAKVLPGWLVRRSGFDVPRAASPAVSTAAGVPPAVDKTAGEAACGTPRQHSAMEITSWLVAAIVLFYSYAPVRNLFSSQQLMNASFAHDPLNLVNTYGAFGSVGQERDNVIFEGTDDAVPYEHAHWKPYLYKGLPVDLDRRPPQIAPYQLRFDWQMWFASMPGASAQDYPFTINAVWKLLHNDPGTLSLFANNPFPDKPPRFVRMMDYRYKFTDPEEVKQPNFKSIPGIKGRYWTRDELGQWLPPLSVDNDKLQAYVSASGWN